MALPVGAILIMCLSTNSMPLPGGWELVGTISTYQAQFMQGLCPVGMWPATVRYVGIGQDDMGPADAQRLTGD